jgi:Alr-MurF fusion protein
MSYSIADIAPVLQANAFIQGNNTNIGSLLTDSRKLLIPEHTLFFALPGHDRNGVTFIKHLYDAGVRNFVAPNTFSHEDVLSFPEANFLLVNDVQKALQSLSAHHRNKFELPIIGITGSNGKTIIKEWLYQLLQNNFDIVRSPKSYNSQVGVPLSVWKIASNHNLGIFEAGISQINEMLALQKIINPQIGIVSFIGSAHDQGFSSTTEKINEKLLLFSNAQTLIYCKDEKELNNIVQDFVTTKNKELKLFTWSKKHDADLRISSINIFDDNTFIQALHKGIIVNFEIPFTDEASIDNAITCCCTLLLLQIPIAQIKKGMKELKPISMRLELKQGINNCSIINDAYSADLESLNISLEFLTQQKQHPKHTIILSDVLQTNKNTQSLYKEIATILTHKKINTLIGIGTDISAHANLFAAITNTSFYTNTPNFLQHFNQANFSNEVILLKGARIFQFEKISALLEQKAHETVLEINLNAIKNNLKVYKQILQPQTKLMAMVKAFSYGSGSFEIANVLQHSSVGYLAVAYTDEGVELRKAGITLPIMVMNAEPKGFENLVKHNLEPEIYSFQILENFNSFLIQQNKTQFPVHIKIDTGMKRLGFEPTEINELIQKIKTTNSFKIISVFSHLAGSDAKDFDSFSKNQLSLLLQACNKIESNIGYNFLKHIANTSAIARLPETQLDMVRLGIGLYGIDSNIDIQNKLLPVATLKTTVAQIKHLAIGETIGYSRKGVATKPTKTATVRIGYADGYPRNLSNGMGKMFINGNAAPVIGNVCMDMTMVDVTDLDVQVGDEVIVFGEEPTVTTVAAWANTISYEILTGISKRVKRVYYEE